MERALADYLTHAPIFVREPGGVITFWSEGAQELYGYTPDEAVGRVSHQLLRTEFPEPLEQIEAALLANGTWQGLLQHQRRSGSRLWTESQWRLRDGDQGPAVVEINTDVTQRETLSHELAHRLKNVLAIVQSLARASLVDCSAASLTRFEQRLHSLSAANDLLLLRSWLGAEIGELVDSTVNRFNVAAQVTAAGPSALLSATHAIGVGLALHELMTNALKYGALSVPQGRLNIAWSVDAAAELSLSWRELGGPPAATPGETGFGLRLIRRALTSSGGGRVEMQFEPEGLVCRFACPTQDLPQSAIPGQRI